MKTYTSQVRTPYNQSYLKPQVPIEQSGSVLEEIEKYIGEYEFTATISEDIDTKKLFSHVPGLISFVCTLRQSKDGRVIGLGRGSSVLSRVNRYVDRTVQSAFNASIVDAIVRSTKILDALSSGSANAHSNESPAYGFDGITDKQRSYLETLIGNVADEDEREQWMERLSTMTRDQASAAIATLKEF